MSTNIEVIDKVNQQAQKNTKKDEKDKPPKSDHFTWLQTLLMLGLTFAISIGGWYYVGKTYVWTAVDMQRVNEQIKYYEQKVASEPKNTENRINLGYSYFLKGENDKAVGEFKQAIQLSKKDKIENFDAYYNLGLVYLDEKRYDDALEVFDKCTKISPRDHKGHLQKGIAYREIKMYKEAMETLEKASKLLPGNADIIFQIGLVAEEQGNKKLAADIYKESLSYDPLFKDAIQGLERVKSK